MADDYGKKFTAQEMAFYMTRPRHTITANDVGHTSQS